MPKAFPIEFRIDVVIVARKGEAPIAEIAKDFGVSESCLQRWLKLADIEDGNVPVSPRVSRQIFARRRSGLGCSSRRTRSCAGRPPICRRPICRENGPPTRP